MPDVVVPNVLRPDPLLPQYRYNPATGRYINAKGRFVPRKVIRGELDLILDGLTARMDLISQGLRNGSIGIGEWQIEMMSLIKTTHLTSGAYYAGGWHNMTQADFGLVGSQVRKEYGFLQKFAIQIENGKQPLDGTLARRARQYGQAGRKSFYEFADKDLKAQGFTQKRSRLTPADHCEGCVREAGKSWVAIDDKNFVPIGLRDCRSNDRCFMEYRKSARSRKVRV